MNKYNSVLAVFIILICAFSVAGASFTATLAPVSDESVRIYEDEVAEFQVVIKNYNDFEDRYLIYSMDPSWIIQTDISPLKISAKSEQKIIVSVDPTSAIAKSGIYSLNLEVKSTATGEIISKNAEVLIKSEMNRQYQPSVTVRPFIGDADVVDPRKEVSLKITLVNRNSLDIPKLTVFVENSFYEETYETALSPNSEIIKLLSYNIDPYTSPSNDTLKIKVFYEGKEITDKRIEYTIQENKLFFTRSVDESKKFLYTRYDVNLTNLGNVKSSEVFSYELSKFANLFTKTVPESNFIVKEDSSALEFELTLNPGDQSSVQITTDYRFTFYTIVSLIALIVVVLLLYYGLRSPIVVTKKATIVAEKDGGTSEIKILLNLRNRTNKILENISVIDRIPDITEIEEEFTIGTLKPTRIVRNSKKGTLIRWDFPNIEGFEERLITYKIHSKLGILGQFSLPPSMVKFDMPNGSKRAVKSKSVSKD